ncbi:MAG: LysR family transcriptional regulator [Bacilli bacterium]|nr:LysR family transcriptional regulator [Bacilli bacterium]
MNVSFDLLRVFKTVAYYGNVSKAAKVLCVTQPSVTKSIKKLEHELNMPLFVREKKGMVLTDRGKTLYRYIIDSINTLDNVELIAKNISANDVGKLRIGAGESVTKTLLKDTIIEYKRIYPGITIELLNLSSDALYNDLRYGRLDLVFINSTIIINENRYKCFKLIDIEDCFFTTPEYYEKIKKVTNMKSILSESLIIQNENYDTRTFLNNICIKNNIQLKPTLEMDRHGLIVEFVKSGLGIGFATKQYIEPYLETGELVAIDVNFNIEKRFINCVYKNDKNPKVNNFIKMLKYNISKKHTTK